MQLQWLKLNISALVLQLPHKVSTAAAQFFYLKYQGIDPAPTRFPVIGKSVQL